MSASTNRKNRQAAREAGTDKKSIAAQKAAAEAAKSKRRWTWGTIGVVLLIVVILLLNSGLVFLTPAYKVGDRSFSAAETNFYYGGQYNYFLNQYGSYASMFGLDTSNGISGLATQECSFSDGGTWKDYFLDTAKDEMLQITALTDYANANSVTLDADEIAEVDESFEGIDEAAKSYGYANADKLLAANYGSGVTQKLARGCYLDSALANKALDVVSDSFVYTQEQLDERYASYDGERDCFDYVYYYVVADTVEVTGEDGETTQETTEDTMKEAKAKSEAIKDAYSEAEGSSAEKLNTAVDMVLPGEIAVEESRAEGSSLVAGSDWFKDSARKDGDITVEEDADGCYVLVFIARDDNSYPVAQVRHILVKAEADEDGNYTDEAKAAAKAKAEEILAEYEAGDKTEESFAALAEEYSEDEGSNTDGGLYDSIAKGQTVDEFDKFCFEGHKKGDTAIVYGESGSYAGYHVMYYVGEGELYRDYLADTDLRADDLDAWLDELKGGYEGEECFGMKFVGK